MEFSVAQALQRAVEAHKAGKLQDAEALYKAILQAQPQHPDANHNLGVMAVSLNQTEAALPLFKIALAANPNQGQFWLSYIDALIKEKHFDNARNVLSQAKKLGLAGERIDDLETKLTASLLAQISETSVNKIPTFTQLLKKVSVKKEKKKNSLSNQINLHQARNPSQVQLNSLLEHYQKGRYDLAENLAKSLTEQYPKHPFAWKMLGVLFQQNGKLQESLLVSQKALRISPDDAEAHSNLGNTLKELDRLAEAETSYKNAITLNPDYVQAYYNLGVTLKELDRLQDAAASYKKAISIKPDYAQAHSNLGNILHELDRQEEAEASYRKAIVIKPDSSEVHYNLGITLKELGKLEEAEKSYKNAIAIKPDYAQAHSNLGIALHELGRLAEAEKSYKNAIAIKSDYAQAHYNLGNTFKELGRLEEAATRYKTAINIKPDLAEAHYNLGNTLKELGRLQDAEASYKNTIAIKPDMAEAHSNLGSTLKKIGRLVEAKKSYQNAITIRPDLVTALQSYSALLAYTSSYRDLCKFSNAALNFAELSSNTADEISELWESRLFTWIYHPDLSSEEICDEHKRWGSKFSHLGHCKFLDHDRTHKRRLRIGYVSPDFRGHSCRFYFEPLFASHDHTRFELFAYANVVHEDEHTQRFKSYFNHWRNILDVSDKDAAEMIRKDKIDILVDGCGHMADNRLKVFAHKPAPIQLTWLGAAWTSGLPQMDYILFDPYMGPEGTAASEQIMRLPRTWCVYRPGERATQASVKISPAVKNGYVTFGYSGRTERLNHRVFHTWGRILMRLPQARLILDFKPFNDPKTQAYYSEFLQAHGVDTSRVIMRNSENVFEGHGDIDILLDSFPHSGGTMLFDAVWMSVPVITLASARPVGRVGTSLMTNLGLPEWISKDEQEYEDKAVAFAQDIPALASLRSGMRARMLSSPVMDEKGFAQDMEAAFETMWATWVASSNQDLLNARNH